MREIMRLEKLILSFEWTTQMNITSNPGTKFYLQCVWGLFQRIYIYLKKYIAQISYTLVIVSF